VRPPPPQTIIINIEGYVPYTTYQTFIQEIGQFKYTASSAIFAADYNGEYELTPVPPPSGSPLIDLNRNWYQYTSDAIQITVKVDNRAVFDFNVINMTLSIYRNEAYYFRLGEFASVSLEELQKVSTNPCGQKTIRIPGFLGAPANVDIADLNVFPICSSQRVMAGMLFHQQICRGVKNQPIFARFPSGDGGAQWGQPPMPFFFMDPPPPLPYQVNTGIVQLKPIFPEQAGYPQNLASVTSSSSMFGEPDSFYNRPFYITRMQYVYPDSVLDLPF
jgi:hypothetical protein